MWTWLDLSKVIIGVIESGETIDDIDFGDVEIGFGYFFYDAATADVYAYIDETDKWQKQFTIFGGPSTDNTNDATEAQ